MLSSDHLPGRMSETNEDLSRRHHSQFDDHTQDFNLQEETCLLASSSRYDQRNQCPPPKNGDCGSWFSWDADTPMVDHDVGDALLWSRFTTGVSSALPHGTSCKYNKMVANENVEESNTLDLSGDCWNPQNCSSCQSSESCYNSQMNRKIDAWLTRGPKNDRRHFSLEQTSVKTFPNETCTNPPLHDNINMAPPDFVSETGPIYSVDARFQKTYQRINESSISGEVINDGKDKLFVLNFDENRECESYSQRKVETSSDDKIFLDLSSEDPNFGIDNCSTVDNNGMNRNESFSEYNRWHQTGDGRLHNENRKIQTHDKSHLNRNGCHWTENESNESKNELLKNIYRNNQIGEENYYTSSRIQTNGVGNHHNENGKLKNTHRHQQIVNENYQISHRSSQTDISNRPTRDRSPQTEDAKRPNGGDCCQPEESGQNTEDGSRPLADGDHQAEFGSCEADERSQTDKDSQIDELNVNNHKIPCMSMKKKLNKDLLRITEENFCLSSQNTQLRENIRSVRKSTVDECSKILDSIIAYCECNANCKPEPRTRRAASCVDPDRVGAGCSTGGCGGYTPSGWNRLMTLHSLECDDPCCPCCCPSCSCMCSCAGDGCGSCCTCCVKQKPRRKRKPCSFTCESKSANENASATHTRPSSKILGELAFQLERRILDYVFGLEGSKRRRFYGYTVNNIQQMIVKESKNFKGEDDPARKSELEYRLNKLLNGLRQTGYNSKIHGDFAQQVINRYGLLSCPPDHVTVEEFGLQNASCIAKLIPQLARGEHEASKFHVLLRSLQYLSKLDNGPLFVW